MTTVEKINLILKKTNISKVNLAKYLGVSRQMVYNYLDSDDLNKMPAEKSQLLFNLLEVKSCEEINEKELTDDYLQSVSNKVFSYKKTQPKKDEIIELAGINNYPIFGMNQPQQAFPIYHVHGFIPYDNSQIIKSVPILSEEEYHRVYANSYNWSNVEQIHALSRTTCIFIGLSMTDPNLRRLLDIAIRDSENEARHFVF